MSMDNVFPILFFAMIALFLAPLVYGMLKYGGFKGAMFRARIDRTVGEAVGGSGRLTSFAVKVHVLESDSPDKAIGLEIAGRSIGSYHMMPVALSVAEASKLAMLLQSAASERGH